MIFLYLPLTLYCRILYVLINKTGTGTFLFLHIGTSITTSFVFCWNYHNLSFSLYEICMLEVRVNCSLRFLTNSFIGCLDYCSTSCCVILAECFSVIFHSRAKLSNVIVAVSLLLVQQFLTSQSILPFQLLNNFTVMITLRSIGMKYYE